MKLLALLFLCGSAAAQNCTTLIYTGAPFHSLVTTGPNYSQIVPLTGTVTLISPLGANLINAPAAPVAWSFTSEDAQFDSVDAQNLLGPAPLQSTFIFSTDANGVITGWDMVVTLQDGPATAQRNTLTAASVPSGDSVSSNHNNVGTPLGPTSIVGLSNSAGVWSCAPPAPIDPLAAQVATLTTQLATANAQITTQAAALAADQTEIASLQTQLAAALAAPTPPAAVPTAVPIVAAAAKPSGGGGSLSWGTLACLALLRHHRPNRKPHGCQNEQARVGGDLMRGDG